MLKKSASSASRSAMTAAAGVSTMMPTWMLGLYGDAPWSNSQLVALHERLARRKLVDAGDERHHDADVAEGARAQQGAQLGAVQVLARQAVADGAEAHERVVLLLEAQVGDLLVAADVERADDDRLALADERGLLVGLELLVLGGHGGFVHEQELGAEQADALGVALHRLRGVVGLADVGTRAHRPCRPRRGSLCRGTAPARACCAGRSRAFPCSPAAPPRSGSG